jgi:hypothetical protein
MFVNEIQYCKHVDSVVCKGMEREDSVVRSDMGRKEHTYRIKSLFVSMPFIAESRGGKKRVDVGSGVYQRK